MGNHPFTVVEEQGFIELIAHNCPKFIMNSRQYYTENLMAKVYTKVSQNSVRPISNLYTVYVFTMMYWNTAPLFSLKFSPVEGGRNLKKILKFSHPTLPFIIFYNSCQEFLALNQVSYPY